MSWLFSNPYKKTPVPQTNLQLQRTKQIESLNQVNAGLTEVIRDIEYRVTFPVNTINYTLIINLPPQFPQAKPTVLVEPLVLHPWVDNSMAVSLCPQLLNFSMHSSLGGAIQCIVDEFRTNPPQPIHSPPSQSVSLTSTQHTTQHASQHLSQHLGYRLPGAYAPPNPTRQPVLQFPFAPAALTNNSVSPTNSEHIPYFYTMPTLPTSFQQLANKTSEELTSLMHDDEKLQELLEGMPELKKITDDKETVSKKCAELANNNLAMKPRIHTLKQRLHTDITKLGSLQSVIDADRIRYTELAHQYSLPHILNNLKVAILEAEEESETVADKFLNNKIVMDEFCKTFLDKRALCHSRRAKEEKLQQIMTSQGHRF